MPMTSLKPATNFSFRAKPGSCRLSQEIMRAAAVLTATTWATIMFFVAPGLAWAQTRLGILVPEMGRSQSQAVKGLGEELRRLGYQERKNLSIEIRNAKGDRGALTPAAVELAGRKLDVIFTTGTRATLAASGATKDLPIVFVHPADPIASGIIKNTPEAAKNLTGIAGYASQMTEKRVALLKEIMPELRQIHIFFDSNNKNSRDNFTLAEAAAKKIGTQVMEHGVKSAEELKSTFGSLRSEPGTAVFHIPDDLVESEAEFIFTTARQKKLPTMFNEESWAIAGATAAYGPNYLDMGRRAAILIEKILKGQKPASLPIERAAKFDLTINYRNANFIGLRLSREILKKADKVIR
jgi:putative ABC transport system substrate-binding protein